MRLSWCRDMARLARSRRRARYRNRPLPERLVSGRIMWYWVSSVMRMSSIFSEMLSISIARSFARIHETNLKKQGILPLTFAKTSDYDLFEPADRVSVRGLAGLAPGKPVEVVIHKAGGKTVTIQCLHTMTDEQIGWFRAGSALNALT